VGGRRRYLAIVAVSLLVAVQAFTAGAALAASPTTTRILYTPPSSIAVGTPAAFTGKIEPDVADLTVSWYVDGVVATTDLTNPNGVSQVSLTFGVGVHEIKAVLEPSADWDGSESDVFTLTVTPAPTTTTLVAPASVNIFDAIHLEASVSPVPDGGLVSFYRDDTYLGSIAPVSGIASYDIPFGLVPGSYVFSAHFDGTPSFDGSSSGPATVVVIENRRAVTVALTSSPNPSLRGDPVALHVTVSPNPGGGTVEIWRPDMGAHLLGPEAVGPGGKTDFTWYPGGPLDWHIQACFSGTDTFQEDCSDILIQTVDSTPSTTTLSVEPNRVYPDQSVTFTVHVDPSPDVATNVHVSQNLGAGGWYVGIDPATGSAQIVLPSSEVALLGVGSHPMIAQFPGTSHLDPSNSAPVPFDVVMDSTSTTVGALPATVAPGEPVSIAVDVVAPASAGDQVWVIVQGPISYPGSFVTIDATGHGELSWDTTGVADGTYLVEATLGATAHTLSSTDRTTFAVVIPDLAPPAGTITVASGSTYSASTTVLVQVPATDLLSGVSEVALSNDGTTWTTRPYAAIQPWTLPAMNGTRTVWAKWKDVAGNWSAAKTDTIVLDTVAPTGNVAIAGGAIYAKTTAVTLAVAATDAGSGVSQVALSNNGTTWTTRAYAASQPWILPATNGTRTVWVKWKDTAGNWSAAKTDTIVLDAVAPTTTAPTWKLGAAGSALVAGAIPVNLAWTGADATSGIASYNLSQQVDGGTWTSLSTTLTSTALTLNLTPGHTYRFALRAIDKASNTGAWSYGPAFVLTAVQQSSSRVVYHGTWTTSTSTTWWGGTAKGSSSAGATASLTFTGRQFAWIGLKAYNRGKTQVYVNGVLAATVDLYSPTLLKQRVLWSSTWSTSATRTVLIKVLGTATRPRIDVDGFITGT
jgi:hypothetical protein